MPAAWQDFENWVREELGIERTSRSGSRHGDGDGRDESGHFILECKDEGGEAIRFPYSQLLKIRRQSALHGQGNWIRAFRNGKGDVVISMNFELAKQMLEIIKEGVVCPKCETELDIGW